MSDFSDRTFVAGSVVGVRSFRVDTRGRLTGVSFQKVFRPGVNEARCYKYENMYSSATVTSSGFSSPKSTSWWMPAAASGTIKHDPKTGMTYISYDIATPHAEYIAKQMLNHDVTSLTCACGYYAYFDEVNSYLEKGLVTGIIEGFGKMAIGDRGFRAEKARLLCLVTNEYTMQTVPIRRVRDNYPDVPVFSNYEDALREFPLSTEFMGIQAADDPTDPTFWE